MALFINSIDLVNLKNTEVIMLAAFISGSARTCNASHGGGR